MEARTNERDRLASAILAGISMDVEDELAGENISDVAQKKIRNELVAEAKHVLESLSLEELRSGCALDRFQKTMLEHARLKLHLYCILENRPKL